MDAQDQAISELLESAQKLCAQYMNAVMFLALDAARDPTYGTNHLLVLAIEDHLEASVGLPGIASKGLLNTCRRELRFLLEASIKLCYAEQALPQGSIDEKLASLQRELDSPNISIRRRLQLTLLPEQEREAFSSQVGRLYGETSKYVHLTLVQVRERDELLKLGASPLTPNAQSVAALLDLLAQVLVASFVYIAHAVPTYAVGDLFVDETGSSRDWELAKNRWIAFIDEHFDYKHERQANIHEIKKNRWSKVAT